MKFLSPWFSNPFLIPPPFVVFKPCSDDRNGEIFRQWRRWRAPVASSRIAAGDRARRMLGRITLVTAPAPSSSCCAIFLRRDDSSGVCRHRREYRRLLIFGALLYRADQNDRGYGAPVIRTAAECLGRASCDIPLVVIRRRALHRQRQRIAMAPLHEHHPARSLRGSVIGFLLARLVPATNRISVALLTSGARLVPRLFPRLDRILSASVLFPYLRGGL